jgi:glyoxylase-like metal-dependent hydrolase (beta-lactamase superfamily II)
MTPGPAFDTSAIRLGRRRFLTLSAASAALPLMARRSWGFGSQVRKTMVGGIELTIVSDGHLTFPASLVAPAAPPEELAALFTAAFGAMPENVMPETNHALLRTGDDLVLIDNGSGNKFQPTAGRLLENLAINGVDPADVTKVIFTHAHPDHVWGTLADDGTLRLPNATFFVGGAEFDFWTNPDTLTMMPADFAPWVIGAARDLNAVAGKMVRVAEGDMVAPGISVIDTPGHTPGHISVLVEGGDGLIVIGDVAAIESVNVAHPEWVFGFDTDPDMGIATRKALLDRAATDGHRILGYHFTYPGLGYVERDGEGFRFVAEA